MAGPSHLTGSLRKILAGNIRLPNMIAPAARTSGGGPKGGDSSKGAGRLMWLMLNDAFFSIVAKDCPRLRCSSEGGPRDIEKVFGRRHVVTRTTKSDYLFRATITRQEVAEVIERELRASTTRTLRAVTDDALHDATFVFGLPCREFRTRGRIAVSSRCLPSKPKRGKHYANRRRTQKKGD